jgi:hypothetical protein
MKTSTRRRLGFVLGFVLGLAHAIVSNLINHIYLPGIPLYVPPPGTFGLIMLTALLFGALGLIAAWTDESIPGVLLSIFVGSIVTSAWTIANEPSDRGVTFVLMFLIFLPRMFFYLPLSAGVRWILSNFEPNPYRVVAPVRRVFPVVIAILIAMASGVFALENRETRQSLVRMNELVQVGMQAGSRSELPKPLQNVEGFISRTVGNYTFYVGPDPDVLPVQRPMAQLGTIEPFIIVEFDNGFRFGCVFSPPYENPACIDF